MTGAFCQALSEAGGEVPHHRRSRGQLVGINRIALVAAAMSVVVPGVIWRIERRLKSRDRREALPLAA